MLNVLLIDDEPLALDVLETFVEAHPGLKMVARCSNATEAKEALDDHVVDLMFLDIQMPGMNGVEFVKSLNHPPMVIFSTAYSDYAIDGFELDAVDYLLKPIALERFNKGVQKALDQVQKEAEETNSALESDEFFFVKADKKLVKINYEDIIYIEGLKDYVIIRMDDSRVITLQTMKSLEIKLPNKTFKRVHRSYIVNLGKINAFEGNAVEVKERKGNKLIPIGKNYKEELMNLVKLNRL